MRINAFLAKAVKTSRRKADSLISDGKVTINDRKAIFSDQVTEDDVVRYENRRVVIDGYKYYMINKPVGYVSTVDDRFADKKVTDLIDEKGLFPVGRLDKDSQGLLILTNDGDFANKLIHPSFDHEKQYVVKVRLPARNFSKHLEDALKFFKCGIRLDDKLTAPAKIKLISQESSIATFEVILKQGIKRQIRRTFEKAGLKVVSLTRLRIANLALGELAPGEYREIDPRLVLGSSLTKA